MIPTYKTIQLANGSIYTGLVRLCPPSKRKGRSSREKRVPVAKTGPVVSITREKEDAK